LSLLHTIVSFVVALGVLIVVHELGHYLVARWAGVKVLRFCVGFGRPLWSRRFGRDQTEWAIAAIPLGGYVKMVDEREGAVAPDDVPRAFNRQSVGKRFLIVLAGPVANFLLAIALYWGLFVGGVQEMKPVVGAPPQGTLAAAAGLKAGDLVTHVDGQPVQSWQEVRWKVLHASLDRRTMGLEVIDAGSRIERRVLDLTGVSGEQIEGDLMSGLGLRPFRPDVAPVIGKVTPGSAAERAGLRAGDRVSHIDREPVPTWDAFVARVRPAAGRPLRFDVERDGGALAIEITPEPVTQNGERIGRIGAAPRVDPEGMKPYLIEVRHGAVEALGLAVAKTWEMSVFSLRMLGRMLTGEVSWKNLSGPVTIADYAGQSAQLGLTPYLAFLALISISLGVLNLLPIPLLDGGHLMYYAVEVVKGSPLSERAMEMGQRAGLALLLFLMAFAFYNDINRLLSG
jgi:regulator of sigma E protease